LVVCMLCDRSIGFSNYCLCLCQVSVIYLSSSIHFILFVDIAIESISFPSLAQVLSEIIHFFQVRSSLILAFQVSLPGVCHMGQMIYMTMCILLHCDRSMKLLNGNLKEL